MFHLTFHFTAGFILILFLVVFIGMFSGRKVKSTDDFITGGRKIGSAVVTGAITAALVGGSSTIGTSQFAFQYGISAWWFTLGMGIACLLLLFLVKPLRKSKVDTLPQFLAQTYGEKTAITSGLFSSVGMFISVISQLLALVALLTSIFHLNPIFAIIIGILLMAGYVIFGGIWGVGFVGIIKLFLIYIFLISASLISYNMVGGITGLKSLFPPYPWFSFFGRGFIIDFSAFFATLLGVICTQSCIQAIISGKSDSTSYKGLLMSALLVPPTGIAGILIGLTMRANFPNIHSAQALPLFFIKYFHPFIGGIAMGTLLIAATGTGASLILGISTTLIRNVYPAIFKFNEKKALILLRLTIVVILILTFFFVKENLSSLILKWNFLSLGLRGVTIFFPLFGSIFFKKYIMASAGFLASIIAPLSMIIWKIFYPEGMNPVFIGAVISLFILIAGSKMLPDKNR